MTNFNLLPIPMWIFRDEDGNPASSGTLESFRADSQSQHKALYEDRAGNIALPNPISLSKAGGLTDAAGNAVPIAYGADDENYFLQIKDQFGNLIATVDDFNANAAFEPSPVEEGDLVKNYILNSQFRFFEESKKSNLANQPGDFPANTKVAIADSGWTFERDNISAAFSIEFKEFTAGQSDVPHTPTYYLYINKTGGASETKNDIRFPLGRIQDFANQQVFVKLYGISATSSNISVLIENNYGTGGSSTITKSVGFLAFNNTWAAATTQFQMPNIAGEAIGSKGDDLVTLILRLPLNANVDLGLVNGQYNFGTTEQPYEFKSYFLDLIEKNGYILPFQGTSEDDYHPVVYKNGRFEFLNTTGEIVTLTYDEVREDCISASGQTIVRTDTITDKRVTYDRLYQTWESKNSNGNCYGYGEDGFFPMIQAENIFMVNEKEEKAITTWSDSDAATETKFTFEEIRTGADYKFNGKIYKEEGFIKNEYPYISYFGQFMTITNVGDGDVTDTSAGNISVDKLIITKIQDGNGGKPEITQLDWLSNGSGLFFESFPFYVSYFLVSSAITDYYVYFIKNNLGADPAIGVRTGLRININGTESITSILLKIKEVLDNTGEFIVTLPYTLQINLQDLGAWAAPVDAKTSLVHFFNIHVGSSEARAQTSLVAVDAKHLSGGEYFELSNISTTYNVWFSVDGVGTSPGGNAIQIPLKSTDDQNVVLWRILQGLKGKACNKITCTAATGLEGKAFLFYNDAESFYNYYTVDGIGVDPELPNKIPVKTELKGSDDAPAVAIATAKAISSYYYVVRDLNGYFLRGIDTTAGVDFSGNYRLPRGDGTFGNNIGSSQADANKSHHHEVLTANGVPSGTAGLATLPDNKQYHEYNSFQQPYTANNGYESRPKNVSVKYCIKF